jgi:hypothetical protein
VRSSVQLRGAAGLVLALLTFSCASAKPRPGQRVDLTPARAAVEDARKAGAPEHAAESFLRAQDNLRKAEAVATGPEAQRLADVAATEARGAATIARLTAEMKKAGIPVPGSAGDRSLLARLRKAEEEQHRLEDRVELLQRDLEVTETELIRSKARLKGNETKAEASAAVAEAQILASRIAQDKTKASTLARCRESLAKAEEQLGLGNYGAAIFFALKAQDTATRSTQETPR